MKVYLDAVAAYSPYAKCWGHLSEILTHDREFDQHVDEVRYQPMGLPRNERRRATDLVRLCFRVLESFVKPDTNATDLAAVFASSGGDYEVVHKISSALVTDERFISPTDFHNSVHNAAAGYWSIATQCHAASTSLSAGDETFGVGLMEAAMLCLSEQKKTLFVAYDIAPPAPLISARPIEQPLAVALLLSPSPNVASIASLELVRSQHSRTQLSVEDEALAERLARGNPIARGLPLLRGLACQLHQVSLDGVDLCLEFDVGQ